MLATDLDNEGMDFDKAIVLSYYQWIPYVLVIQVTTLIYEYDFIKRES